MSTRVACTPSGGDNDVRRRQWLCAFHLAPQVSHTHSRTVAAVQFRPLTSAPGWLVATKRSKFSRLSSCQLTGALQCPKPQSKSSEAREPYPESYPRAIPRTIPAIHTPYTNLPARPRQKNTYPCIHQRRRRCLAAVLHVRQVEDLERTRRATGAEVQTTAQGITQTLCTFC